MFKHMQSIWSLALAAAVLILVPARVHAQTPEGTVITNTATASYTDANGNPYADVTGSVSVTVGFLPGIAVRANTPSQTPASPSTGGTLSFGVANPGNGTDSVTISEGISVPGVITVTAYRYASADYATLALLNDALSAAAIPQGDSITIEVLYDVASNQGGVNTIYTLTANSRRAPTTTDNDPASITPSQTYCVGSLCSGGGGGPGGGGGSGGGDLINIGFGADSILNVSKVPGQYTVTYYFVNGGNGTDSFDLLARIPGGGSVITRVTMDGVSSDSLRITLAAGAEKYIAVVYNVADVAAGSKDSIFLRVRSVGDSLVWHDGILALTVVKPALELTKQAYRNDGLTLIGLGDEVLPGEYIRYRMTVTNNGTTDAVSVQVTDTLPAQVTYDSSSGSGWSIGLSGATVTADWAGNLASLASATFEVRVRIN